MASGAVDADLGRARAVIAALPEAVFVTEPDGELRLTTLGQAEYDRIAAAWRDWISSELGDWDNVKDAEFEQALSQVAREIVMEDADSVPAEAVRT